MDFKRNFWSYVLSTPNWYNVCFSLRQKDCSMNRDLIITNIKNFRNRIYDFFRFRKDASMDLIDALSSNKNARSVTELSTNEFYTRNYCSISRSLDEFYSEKNDMSKEEINQSLSHILIDYCPTPGEEKFYVFGVDCTPAPRKHADTLEDKGFVHQPNTISSNKPITIGHQYSILACLPKQEKTSWVWPISCLRVKTSMKGTVVGMNQINDCISQPKFTSKLCVSVGDSAYSTPECITISSSLSNQIHISRLRNNRVLYRKAKSSEKKQRGRPKKYGNKFNLKDGRTFGKPEESDQFESHTKKGEAITVKIDSWDNIIIRGKKDKPMHDKPIRLIRVRIFNKSGSLKYKRPLWLMASGTRRNELSLREAHEVYKRRFDLEHFFRYGKNKLLMDKCQSPETDHEEAWWQFSIMAYASLYLSKDIVESNSTPWGKYLPNNKNIQPYLSPSQVQSGLSGIIRDIGTPAKLPKTRNKSIGRLKGDHQSPRTRHPVVRKSKKKEKKAA